MKDVSAEVNLKAAIAAIIGFLIVMGTIGVYFSVQCGPHWFMYVMSFSLFAVPAMLLVYGAFIVLLARYDVGRVGHWLLAAALSLFFFGGCFVYAHLQPATPFYTESDCQPI
jgi:hypothetical protein